MHICVGVNLDIFVGRLVTLIDMGEFSGTLEDIGDRVESMPWLDVETVATAGAAAGVVPLRDSDNLVYLN